MAEIPTERVVLELTEHTGIDDYHLFGEAISELRSNGLRLAVDDAGAGFSSFRHILNLRPDIIKLDIALTRGIDTDPARRASGWRCSPSDSTPTTRSSWPKESRHKVSWPRSRASDATTARAITWAARRRCRCYLGNCRNPGAHPSPVLRRSTVNPDLVLPPGVPDLEHLREEMESASRR
jgi:hypothetical protein